MGIRENTETLQNGWYRVRVPAVRVSPQGIYFEIPENCPNCNSTGVEEYKTGIRIAFAPADFQIGTILLRPLARSLRK